MESFKDHYHKPKFKYIGDMENLPGKPALELFNTLVPLGHHPVHSTIARSTIESFGYKIPDNLKIGQEF